MIDLRKFSLEVRDLIKESYGSIFYRNLLVEDERPLPTANIRRYRKIPVDIILKFTDLPKEMQKDYIMYGNYEWLHGFSDFRIKISNVFICQEQNENVKCIAIGQLNDYGKLHVDGNYGNIQDTIHKHESGREFWHASGNESWLYNEKMIQDMLLNKAVEEAGYDPTKVHLSWPKKTPERLDKPSNEDEERFLKWCDKNNKKALSSFYPFLEQIDTWNNSLEEYEKLLNNRLKKMKSATKSTVEKFKVKYGDDYEKNPRWKAFDNLRHSAAWAVFKSRPAYNFLELSPNSVLSKIIAFIRDNTNNDKATTEDDIMDLYKSGDLNSIKVGRENRTEFAPQMAINSLFNSKLIDYDKESDGYFLSDLGFELANEIKIL